MTIVLLIVRRIAGLLGTLLVASFAVYGALYLAPGDVATTIAGGEATPAQLAAVRAQYHLNDPFILQYWHWLGAVLHGQFGQSALFHQAVTALLASRLVNTLCLVGYASVIIVVVGIGLGIVAGLYPRRIGKVVMAWVSVGVAVPSFVAAVVLLSIFSVSLGWFPVLGAGSGFVGRIHHLTLPAIALATPTLAYICNVTAAEVRKQVGQEHVQTARVRGIPWRTVVRRHVLRNSMIPVTTASILASATLLAGGAVVEVAFGINGIGAYLVEAVQQRDIVPVQAIALILVAAFVVASTLIDILYTILDPRLSHSRA